ncbi:hypothetical protein EGT07_26425 [Herbaspirillum sp. HC18]|nr:hypothetical protein EGT07_26425 [Herbaspirillum sp. HC18]
MQPKVFISYSPGKPGSVFALFYCESGHDVFGWHIESRDPYFSAAFFLIEDFYADLAPHLYRSIEDDVYGPWTIDYPPGKYAIRSPVADTLAHELERLQSNFVEEWLFFGSDAHIEPEVAAYRLQGLPMNEVNIKWHRLQRMHKDHGRWMHTTQGIDPNIVQLLRKYWRLNEKVPAP